MARATRLLWKKRRMANYIEREDDCLCSSSNTTVVTDDTYKNDALDRWDWLLSGWDQMTILEKFQIFMPYLHYINLRDFYKEKFDEELNKNIVENSYKLCRSFSGQFKFDPDQQGTPNLIITYNPVDIDQIPYAGLKNKVIEFGEKFGIYTKNPFIPPEFDNTCPGCCNECPNC